MTCSGVSTAHGPAITARRPPPTTKAPAETTVGSLTSVARGASLRRGGGTWSGAGPSQTSDSPAFAARPAVFASDAVGTAAKPRTGDSGLPGSVRISAPASCSTAASRAPEKNSARTVGSASERRVTAQKRVAFGFTSETSSRRTTSPASSAASSEQTAARGPPSSATRRAANAVSWLSTLTASSRARTPVHWREDGRLRVDLLHVFLGDAGRRRENEADRHGDLGRDLERTAGVDRARERLERLDDGARAVRGGRKDGDVHLGRGERLEEAVERRERRGPAAARGRARRERAGLSLIAGSRRRDVRGGAFRESIRPSEASLRTKKKKTPLRCFGGGPRVSPGVAVAYCAAPLLFAGYEYPAARKSGAETKSDVMRGNRVPRPSSQEKRGPCGPLQGGDAGGPGWGGGAAGTGLQPGFIPSGNSPPRGLAPGVGVAEPPARFPGRSEEDSGGGGRLTENAGTRVPRAEFQEKGGVATHVPATDPCDGRRRFELVRSFTT